jgi:hypothetical protein
VSEDSLPLKKSLRLNPVTLCAAHRTAGQSQHAGNDGGFRRAAERYGSLDTWARWRARNRVFPPAFSHTRGGIAVFSDQAFGPGRYVP